MATSGTAGYSWRKFEREAASTTSMPFNREENRWAIRRVLLQPALWPDVHSLQGEMRRIALESLLDLCKEPRERAVGRQNGKRRPPTGTGARDLGAGCAQKKTARAERLEPWTKKQ